MASRRGTGLPLPQNDVLIQPTPGAEKAQAFSSAEAWGEVARAGAHLRNAGVDMIERETHEAQTGYLANQELDVDRDFTNMIDAHSKDGPDPQGFDKAWTAYSDGRLSKAEPWAVNHLRKLLKGKGNQGYASLLNQKRGQDRELNAKAISSLVEQAGDDVIGAAMNGSLGTDDGKAKLLKLRNAIDAGVTANLIPQVEADQKFQDVTSRAQAEVIIKHIGDTYDANVNKGDALKAAMDQAEKLILRNDDPALKGLSEAQRHSYFNQATAEIRARDAERKIGIATLKGQIADVSSTAADGVLPSPRVMGELRAAVNRSGDPELAADLNNAQLMADTFEATSKTPLPELQSYVTAERQRLASGGGTRPEVDRLKATERVLSAAETGLKSDPVAWAERSGLAPRTDLDFTNGDTLAQSLKARVPVAEIGAQHYGVTPAYLKEPEKRLMIATANAGGDKMLDMLSAVASTGTRAPAVLADIFPDAPATAMLGGLIAETGVSPVARDAADAIKLKNDMGDKFKSIAPSTERSRSLALGVLGDSLSEMPKSEAALISLTNQAYEIRARRINVASGKDSDVDPTLWKQTFRDIIGERTVNGETYGGVVGQTGWFSGGNKIILPPSVKQDTWRDVLDTITPGDLDRAGIKRPVGAGGKQLPVSLIRSGTLVPVGSGRFAVALGNPSEPGAERWLMADPVNDEKFILDLNALAPLLKARRPDLFLGG